MFIVNSAEELTQTIRQALAVAPGNPVLLDKFLEDAIELDVDAISDGETTVIGGMLEHIEQAGVHSGDAAMVLPPHTLSEDMMNAVRQATYALARELKVKGLMNVQFAIQRGELYVLEVNPRASRTIPFVSKVIGKPLAKFASRVMAGEKLKDIGFFNEVIPLFWAIKESVFPFARFPGTSIALTPEMRSTGEVMGLDKDLGLAFAKTQMAASPALPEKGNVFISVKDTDKPAAVKIARELQSLGFNLYSTHATSLCFKENNISVTTIRKLKEGRPNVVDLIKNEKMQMIINTPSGMIPRRDENIIRTEALKHKVCMITTLKAAEIAVMAIRSLKEKECSVNPLQDYIKQCAVKD